MAKAKPAKPPVSRGAENAAGNSLVALVAIEPIRCDGADIAPGESFKVFPDVADTLLGAGAARHPDAE